MAIHTTEACTGKLVRQKLRAFVSEEISNYEGMGMRSNFFAVFRLKNVGQFGGSTSVHKCLFFCCIDVSQKMDFAVLRIVCRKKRGLYRGGGENTAIPDKFEGWTLDFAAFCLKTAVLNEQLTITNEQSGK